MRDENVFYDMQNIPQLKTSFSTSGGAENGDFKIILKRVKQLVSPFKPLFDP